MSKKLEGKTVVLGVSGGIAAYKIASLASMLQKAGANTYVIMTDNARQFITPLTFETLTKNKCLVDTFDRNFKFDVEHIEIAKATDVFMVAPATANIIAKMAHGIADDMLTTTFLAATRTKIISPSMNTAMLYNPITQENIMKLRGYGVQVVESARGLLACGDTGSGKLPEPEILYAHIEKALLSDNSLEGKKVLITAGATREAMDPVRFITNHSTGKMGFALARECERRGAEVVVVKAHTSSQAPLFSRIVDVESAGDMFEAVKKEAEDSHIIIKAAAVSDYTPANYRDNKVKKKDGEMSIALKRTEDIAAYLGERKKEGQVLCGFSMETENLEENSRKKLEKKNMDMIVANNLKVFGAGFGTDTNVVTLITRDGIDRLELMTKDEVSKIIVDRLVQML